jgi:acyl-CoA thioesterase-1
MLAQPLSANNTAESPLRLLVLGDSLVAGYGLAVEDAFPEQLEISLREAGYNVKVINAGVSGDTSAGGLSRLDWTLNDNPQMVIVELGANDALRGLPVEQTFQNLDAILGQLKEKGIEVLIAGMQAPRNLGEDYTKSFDRIYPMLADKHNVALYPFFLDGVALNPALNQPDGIHPNPDGVKIIVSRILPYVINKLSMLSR